MTLEAKVSTVARFLLLCTAALLGCGRDEPPTLYLYCNETFWYVMQEEALAFNKIYGFQIVMIPVRSQRIETEPAADSVEIDGNTPLRRSPTPWRSLPKNNLNDSEKNDPQSQIHPDIDRQINSIAENSFGDLFLTDSKKQIAKLQKSALSIHEFPVCYLNLVMLVPRGNPHRLKTAKSVLDANRKLGIVNPMLDGLGEASWEILSRTLSGGESAIPKELVRMFDRQYDLLEALENGEVDAVLVWNATSETNYILVKYADEYNAAYEPLMREVERKRNKAQLRKVLQGIRDSIIEEKSFAEEVILTPNVAERFVAEIPLVALGTADNYGYCERFADYLRSRQGKAILEKFGFVAK